VAISPGEFQRPYLGEGHAAQSPSSWTAGIPDSLGGDRGRVARTGPAGPAGPPGSGTGDRTMAVSSRVGVQAREDAEAAPDGDDWLDEHGTGIGTGEDGPARKGMVPASFHRPYLAPGHQSDSPANTGLRGTTAVPETARDAEPQDFTRGWIRSGHQAEPPDDRPPNNPHPAGTPGAAVYRSAAGAYEANQAGVRTEHVMPSQAARSEPAPARVVMPPDMRAASVPVAVQVAASRPAPGETR